MGLQSRDSCRRRVSGVTLERRASLCEAPAPVTAGVRGGGPSGLRAGDLRVTSA